MSDDYPDSEVLSDGTISNEDNDENLVTIIDDECVDDVDGDDDPNDDPDDDHDDLSIAAALNRNKKQIYVAVGKRISVYYAVIIFIFAIVSIGTSSIVSYRKKKSDSIAFRNRLKEVTDYLWENKISAQQSLITLGTPEHYASVFMADAENYQSQMVPGNEQHFVERYILALIYYGMNGAQWTNQYDFLHAKDHCLWTGTSSTIAGSLIKGVECNDKGYVIGIDLSNNNLIFQNIPKEIHRLLHLRELHLGQNKPDGDNTSLALSKNK